MKKQNRLVRLAIWSLWILVSTAVLAEIMLRVASIPIYRRPATLTVVGPPDPPRPPHEEARFGELLRLGPTAELPYRLRPQLDLVFKGASVTTDAGGYRHTPASCEEPRAIRVVGLGDSVLFGWAVEADETAWNHIAAALNRDGDECWSFLNTAAPGYNTTNEIAVFESLLATQSADLVLLHYHPNDLDVADPVRRRRTPWAPNSFLFGRLRGLSLKAFVHHRVAFLDENDRVRVLNSEMHRIPVDSRSQLGIPGVQRAFEKLARLQAEHGFELQIVSHAPFHPEVQRIATALGLPTFSAGPALARIERERGWSQVDPSPLVISRTDGHPSALSHEIQADHYLEELGRTGVLDRLLDAARNDVQANPEGIPPSSDSRSPTASRR